MPLRRTHDLISYFSVFLFAFAYSGITVLLPSANNLKFGKPHPSANNLKFGRPLKNTSSLGQSTGFRLGHANCPRAGAASQCAVAMDDSHMTAARDHHTAA